MPEPRVFNGVDSVKAAVGEHLGYSDWLEITQERVNTFAEATGDFQWIHVDEERAKDTPFGGTIAHGLYTLSLGPKFSYAMFSLEGFTFGLNYGYDKVRFPAPVPVGSRVRMRATLSNVSDVAGGLQITITQTFEIEGAEKPACVAESLSRVYGG